MSNYFNNKPFKPTKVGIIKAVGQKIGSLIKGKGKVSPTITKVEPNVPVTRIEKAKSKLAIAKQKTKASEARLNQTRFRIEQQKKRLEKRDKKMGGGFMGKRMGYKKGSKKFPDLTGDGKVTFADILKGRGVINGKKKSGKRMQAREGTKPFNEQKSIIDKQGKRGNIVGIGTIQKAPSKVLTKRKGSR